MYFSNFSIPGYYCLKLPRFGCKIELSHARMNYYSFLTLSCNIQRCYASEVSLALPPGLLLSTFITVSLPCVGPAAFSTLKPLPTTRRSQMKVRGRKKRETEPTVRQSDEEIERKGDGFTVCHSLPRTIKRGPFVRSSRRFYDDRTLSAKAIMVGFGFGFFLLCLDCESFLSRVSHQHATDFQSFSCLSLSLSLRYQLRFWVRSCLYNTCFVHSRDSQYTQIITWMDGPLHEELEARDRMYGQRFCSILFPLSLIGFWCPS